MLTADQGRDTVLRDHPHSMAMRDHEEAKDQGEETERSTPGCIQIRRTLVGNGLHMGIDLNPGMITAIIDRVFTHTVNEVTMEGKGRGERKKKKRGDREEEEVRTRCGIKRWWRGQEEMK